MKASDFTDDELNFIAYGLGCACDNLYREYEYYRDNMDSVNENRLKHEYDECWSFYQKIEKYLENKNESK